MGVLWIKSNHTCSWTNFTTNSLKIFSLLSQFKISHMFRRTYLPQFSKYPLKLTMDYILSWVLVQERDTPSGRKWMWMITCQWSFAQPLCISYSGWDIFKTLFHLHTGLAYNISTLTEEKAGILRVPVTHSRWQYVVKIIPHARIIRLHSLYCYCEHHFQYKNI